MQIDIKSKIPAEIIKTVETLNENGFQAYIVGGSIRDIILKRSVSDFDIATNAHPEQIQKLFKKTIPTGIKHGTITVLENKTPIEVTTFRTDGEYFDGRLEGGAAESIEAPRVEGEHEVHVQGARLFVELKRVVDTDVTERMDCPAY